MTSKNKQKTLNPLCRLNRISALFCIHDFDLNAQNELWIRPRDSLEIWKWSNLSSVTRNDPNKCSNVYIHTEEVKNFQIVQKKPLNCNCKGYNCQCNFKTLSMMQSLAVMLTDAYRIVASSNTRYNLGNPLFVKRSQYIRIENPLHKQSEKACK